MAGFVESINNFSENIINYFKSLSRFEQIAWGAIALGIVLIIVAILIW